MNRPDKLDDARKRLNMLEYCQRNSDQPDIYTKSIKSVSMELKGIKEEWQRARESGELKKEFEDILKKFHNNGGVDIA